MSCIISGYNRLEKNISTNIDAIFQNALSWLLQEPKTKLVTVGDRAFSSYAPRLWNTLPLDIRTLDSTDAFKSGLKPYLFKSYYKH